jgi:hypothetical protein
MQWKDTHQIKLGNFTHHVMWVESPHVMWVLWPVNTIIYSPNDVVLSDFYRPSEIH